MLAISSFYGISIDLLGEDESFEDLGKVFDGSRTSGSVMRVLGLLFFCSMLLLASIAFSKEQCPKGEHWVSSHYRGAYTRYDGTRVKATQVSSYCRKNPRGYEKWYQRLSNSRPKFWGYKEEKSKKWTVEEIERLYDAISVLPENLINLENITIYRMGKSKLQGNPAISNSTDIVLYDLAFQHKYSLAQILSHELSHILFTDLSQSEKEQFAEKSNWVVLKMRNETIYVPNNKRQFLQEDSAVSIDEDFANHIEEYLFDREKLSKVSPNSILWIQKKYGDGFKIQKRNEK